MSNQSDIKKINKHVKICDEGLDDLKSNSSVEVIEIKQGMPMQEMSVSFQFRCKRLPRTAINTNV